MQNLTTAAIVLCPELSTTGLTQSMHDPSVELRFEDLLKTPATVGDDIGPDITRNLISDAIKRIHDIGVNQMNLLSTIVRTYWTPISRKQSNHCLTSDMIKLNI